MQQRVETKGNGELIVFVDDELDLGNLFVRVFEQAGYQAIAATTAREAMLLAATRDVDLMVLDWMLPDQSGLEVCQALRADPRTARLPIILATARGGENERVAGLEAGADDYVVKPFNLRELVLRVRAVLRRHDTPGPRVSRVLRQGGLEVDVARLTARIDGSEVLLRPLELRLLLTLMSNPGQVFNRRDLISAVWGQYEAPIARTIDVHVRRLRERLGSAAELVETVHGSGYRFRAA